MYIKHTTYQLGCNLTGNSTTGLAAATAAAKDADLTVLVIGITAQQEGEMNDRVNLTLPGVQSLLVQEVANAAPKPIVVVVMCGGPLDISAIMANPKVGAVLWIGYPGQSGGQAMADILFGTTSPGACMDGRGGAGSFGGCWGVRYTVHLVLMQPRLHPRV